MIEIEINDAALRAALQRLIEGTDDMTPAMGRIANDLRDGAEDRFARQVAPDGTPWAPRSAVTLARYLAGGESFGGVLHKTGTMRGNIGTDYGPDFAEVGSNAIQSGVMQFGAPKGTLGAYFGTDKRGRSFEGYAPWGHIPARPFLGLSDEDEQTITLTIEDWLARAAQGG